MDQVLLKLNCLRSRAAPKVQYHISWHQTWKLHDRRLGQYQNDRFWLCKSAAQFSVVQNLDKLWYFRVYSSRSAFGIQSRIQLLNRRMELWHFTLWINSRRLAIQRHRRSYGYPATNHTRRYKDAQRHRPIDEGPFVMHFQRGAKSKDIN